MRADLVINYAAVFAAAIVALLLVAVAFIIAYLLAPHYFDRAKASTYECGMVPIGANWGQIHVRYYIFAILFLIFDVETVFLYPWAVVFVDIGAFAFWEMMLFIVILLFGLTYAWKKGVLQWR